MKRIEATIQVDKAGAVSDAIKDKVGGYTILEGNGRGSGKRQTMRAGRGTGTFEAE
jgi:nitrogen regulatory protein P-II 1